MVWIELILPGMMLIVGVLLLCLDQLKQINAKMGERKETDGC